MTWRPRMYVFAGVGLVAVALHATAVHFDDIALNAYRSMQSNVTYDRSGEVLRVSLNDTEQVCMFAATFPDHVKELVLTKEDQWFYYHPGINPYRTLIVSVEHLRGVAQGGASSITQQLAKTLLGNTYERSIGNKVRELGLAFVLEYRHNKDEILRMYLNTVPLGGNVQGFPAAARGYFDKQVGELNENETLQLVAALSNPDNARPLSETNLARALELSSALGAVAPMETETATYKDTAWLELADMLADCTDCTVTLDSDLNSRIRSILKSHIERGREYGITHGAVAVIDTHTGELLALVGSPAPESRLEGMRINMALETRPVGSTIKPFVYLLGFTKGLRPYTLVDDREYKFDIETGFPLYPKNYDGLYRGSVTLEEALANSLNVPAVEVLRFNTLTDTYEYLERTLGFSPRQSWESYAYGIALGGLELDLVTLTHAFTALGNRGELVPLISGYRTDGSPHYFSPPHSTLAETTQIALPEYVALLNTILTDRTAGVEQFGQKGSLNLSRTGYGVKTGTSRDYHDSWTVGYTSDYAVGVWLGNVENTPMNKVSGSTGAGSVWHDVMELMFTTAYYSGTPLDNAGVTQIPHERGYVYGFSDDDVAVATSLMQSDELILFPHNHDTFLLTEDMRIPLQAAERVSWDVNETSLGAADAWYPSQAGTYTLSAHTKERSEHIEIEIVEDATSLP